MTSGPAVLPLAIVMIAGPQILSATVLATSERVHQNSLSFIAGVSAATTIGVSIAYFLSKELGASTGSQNSSSGNQTVDYLIIALLLALLVQTFRNRRDVKTPKWMSRLQTATPRFAFLLGLVLFLVMPTDVISMITVGSFQAAQKAPWWHNLYFVALTALLISIPYLLVLSLGRRAHIVLPKVRDWMTSHSWVVNEIVILFFLVLTVSNTGG